MEEIKDLQRKLLVKALSLYISLFLSSHDFKGSLKGNGPSLFLLMWPTRVLVSVIVMYVVETHKANFY